jgi:dynactin complex subunit
MKQLNTVPIENYLDKVRIAGKSKAKTVILDINEAQALSDSLAVVMTRLTGELDKVIQTTSQSPSSLEVSMDGGTF